MTPVVFDELLTIDELEANTRQLAGDARVGITRLGESRLGRPIDMISIGDGDRDALIVGVPHPNEPAGAVTIERMIALLLTDETQRRGYRWHFIKAIDPEGLKLNQGWLKSRTLAGYFDDFFRPALHRQGETTFPLDVPEAHFDASVPENHAWRRAFELTRPALHASLHHCDYGGVFYSLSRALPGAIEGLELVASRSGLGVNDMSDGVMDAEQWSPAVKRYPSVPELIVNAKASGAAWAYPWTVGEMSPGYGEAQFGTFTLIAEAPLWDAASLHDHTSSGVTRRQQQSLLRVIAAKAREIAVRHVELPAPTASIPDAKECLWALERGLQMMPASQAHSAPTPADDQMLSKHEFELLHTEQALFVLRTYGLIVRLANLILVGDPANRNALRARKEAHDALRHELALIESRTVFVPIPLSVVTEFQMQSIFVCADALTDAA
jgi:hypothetical protein